MGLDSGRIGRGSGCGETGRVPPNLIKEGLHPTRYDLDQASTAHPIYIRDYRGYPRQERERLAKRVKALHQRGLQVAVHGNGDAAIDDILNAFAEAQKEHPREDARHRIEHCQMAREDQLDRMREMGISPSFFVGHVYYWGDRHRDIFMGPERARRISPLASALRRGIRFTVHDDSL